MKATARDLAVLLALPILWFNQVLWPGLSGKSLLPFDNLYAFEPWHSLRPDVEPYNPLVSDLVLESVVWELAVRRSMASGEIPLWNPAIMAGVPLLANAQGSVLYPPDYVLSWLPLPAAFGWYTALHISLAGLGMYVLGQALGLLRPGALLAGVAFMFSGMLITSATFPQWLGAAAWLPMLLALVELIVRDRDAPQRVWACWLLGVLIVGAQFLAGHPEVSSYALITLTGYSVVRLATVRAPIRSVALLLTLIGLGTALAAVQLLPTLEAVANNARTGARSATDLAAVAWPLPQLWTLLLPDLFGNPTHRQWLDIWSATWREAAPIFWGTKNYVEGAQYVGVLTLLLAALGLLRGYRRPALIFGGLALISLLLVLGSPLYLLLQALPGFSQLRSPFRWSFPFVVAVCVLAGLGLDVVLRKPGAARRIGVVSLVAGGVALSGVALSLIQPEPVLKLAQRLVTDPAWAERAFGRAGLLIPTALPTPAMFWGYESQGVLRLGLVLLIGGLLLRLRWPALVIGVIAVDLFSVHGRFLPATDLSLSPLDAPRPPVVQAIDDRETSGEPWRFITYERGDEKTFLANAGMYYGWQDARGYDSIIPRWYAEYTQRLGLPGDSLAFNRIAPAYNAAALNSVLLNLLNVKYVLTEQRIDDPKFVEVYRDAYIAAYENTTVVPRSFVAPFARVLPPNEQPLERTDPRDVVYLEVDPGPDGSSGIGRGTSRVSHYGPAYVTLDVTLDAAAWVVLADSWGPGWHARASATDGSHVDLEIYRAYSTLRAVRLPGAGAWTVEFTYWPDSFRLGLLISGATLLLLLIVSALLLVTNRRSAWAADRSAPNRPLRAPYSPAGRGA